MGTMDLKSPIQNRAEGLQNNLTITSIQGSERANLPTRTPVI